MDEDTQEFPAVEVVEDYRPLDMTTGWEEHIEDEHDPLDPNPPTAIVTILDEELDDE